MINNKNGIHILLKIILSFWIFLVVLVTLIISGSNEFKVFINYFFPNFVNSVNTWLVPLLSAPYQG